MLLSDALGSADVDFTNNLLRQLASASCKDGVDERGLNFMVSVKGIQPRDQLEAMLAAQMAAIHMATMTFTRRLARVETIAQQDSALRERRRTSDCRQCYANRAPARTGGGAKTAHGYYGCATSSNRVHWRNGTTGTSTAADPKEMIGDLPATSVR